eukprot:TRINITY_DN12433_c0_g2_i6.p1 TRINITY_DN12433_c0_g2~~TRINITY_DN12433_c0_g2_i6.p1  ORF type:complete len:359 (-),score=47.43 TRINITY_DN12433_c0_g2_i6:503-1579(-)
MFARLGRSACTTSAVVHRHGGSLPAASRSARASVIYAGQYANKATSAQVRCFADVASTSGSSSPFKPTSGPDGVAAKSDESLGQPAWPAGWHDSLQYHFFFDDLFVHARVFLTPSLEQTSVWIFDHETGRVEELLNTSERLCQKEGAILSVANSRVTIEDGPGGGSLALIAAGGSTEEMRVDFQNRHVLSWLPAGQTADAVIHRPDLEVSLRFRGREMLGRGYSKRYYGEYGPHWGYRFIQSSSLGGRYFLWTADATFRIGNGEAKYNYFKLLDAETGELTQADSRDTYQQDSEAHAYIGGERYVASVEPLGEWMHDYKGGDTHSRMQLRYCRVRVQGGALAEALEGFALNERCFGVL